MASSNPWSYIVCIKISLDKCYFASRNLPLLSSFDRKVIEGNSLLLNQISRVMHSLTVVVIETALPERLKQCIKEEQVMESISSVECGERFCDNLSFLLRKLSCSSVVQ